MVFFLTQDRPLELARTAVSAILDGTGSFLAMHCLPVLNVYVPTLSESQQKYPPYEYKVHELSAQAFSVLTVVEQSVPARSRGQPNLHQQP